MIELTNEEMLGTILKNLSNNEKEESIIYWDKKLLEKGDQVKIGKTTIKMPFTGYLVFVDLEPKANWGHSCRYFLVDTEIGETRVIKEELPPYFGDYPKSFKVIQRYGKKPPHDRYFDIFNDNKKGGEK